ncbi:hypothetical protein H6P81_015494 [Aristolochia fimbriata]|uniref:SKP1-like protein n=1 Tax=Aristolochia fimbriata TaxID=158543 RepID=A0AAV7E5Y0_ARIFI|nr:hypothetical protein H6P81_015494 [Aristolochia fimbriata]
MSCSKEKKRVALESSDGKVFEVDENVARMLTTIEHLVESECDNAVVPVPNVTGEILEKVLEYCNYKASLAKGKAKSKQEIEEWEAEFIDVDYVTLYHLLLACNFLSAKGLLDLALDKTANMIRGKYPQEIRDTFHIANDFTPEQEIEMRKKNPWAFEGEPGYDDLDNEERQQPLQPASDQTGSQSQPSTSQTEPLTQEAKGSESEPQEAKGSESEPQEAKGSEGSESEPQEAKGSESEPQEAKGSEGSESEPEEAKGSESQPHEAEGSESQTRSQEAIDTESQTRSQEAIDTESQTRSQEAIDTESQPRSQEAIDTDSQPRSQEATDTDSQLPPQRARETDSQSQPGGASEIETESQPLGASEIETESQPLGASEIETESQPLGASETESQPNLTSETQTEPRAANISDGDDAEKPQEQGQKSTESQL